MLPHLGEVRLMFLLAHFPPFSEVFKQICLNIDKMAGVDDKQVFSYVETCIQILKLELCAASNSAHLYDHIKNV